ncbi:MAG: esterase family protein [Anaerolineaceae bacterium]|nr:esterase family protein [Anaerolineaceae bacterium]
MALIRFDHLPESIKINTPLNIILPDPGDMRDMPIRKRKVLYLLHGLSDDASAWQRFSSIETIARAYGLVVVMPSVGRSFYTDQPNGQLYFTYLTQELPQYLSDVFNLTPEREDTLIAGISMGGYGAFKVALHFPQRFFAAASFSGALSLEILRAIPNDPRQAEFEHIFGDLNKLGGGLHDPMVWLKNAAENNTDLPRLFIACGRQDDLYPLNVMINSLCQSMGIHVDYHEEDGKHDWPFWDKQIQRFLEIVLD